MRRVAEKKRREDRGAVNASWHILFRKEILKGGGGKEGPKSV